MWGRIDMVRLRNSRTSPDVYINGYEVRLPFDSLHGASVSPINRPLISSLVIATALLIAPFAHGQKSTDVLPAPLPAQIHNSKKVFISNAGGDTNYLYSGGPDRLYDHFYAAIQSWGRYQLVTSPAEADLVFAVSFSNQFVAENGPTGNGSSQHLVGRSLTDSQFRLTILDPGTRVTLWTLTTICSVAGQSRQELR